MFLLFYISKYVYRATCGHGSGSPESSGWLQGGQGSEGVQPLALEVPWMMTGAGEDRLGGEAEYQTQVHGGFGSRMKCVMFFWTHGKCKPICNVIR